MSYIGTNFFYDALRLQLEPTGKNIIEWNR